MRWHHGKALLAAPLLLLPLSACKSTNANSSAKSLDGAATTAASHTDGQAFITHFDATIGQQPTGLGLSPDHKTAYTVYNSLAKVVQVSLPDGAVSDFGTLPDGALGSGFINGMEVDKNGIVYIGVLSIAPNKIAPAVYQFPAGGGVATIYAQAPTMVNPNKFVFDDSGNLYITDSSGGGLWKAGPGGTPVAKWSSDPLLNPDATAPCHNQKFPFPFGPAGITRVGNTLYVSNSDKASLVKVPINADGTAGTASLVGSSDANCSPFGGGDGLDFDPAGNVYEASNNNRILRIRPEGTVEILTSGGILDLPASVRYWVNNGVPSVLISNGALISLRSEVGDTRAGVVNYSPVTP